jgi:two-component system response regulator RegX3
VPPEGQPKRVLVIEDEESIAEPLASALEREGFAPTVAPTAAEGLHAFGARTPDVVLLDVMLPDGDGRDVLREIRRRSRVPILMVTARDQPVDKVVGLELGADDYVTKPFQMAELVARMRAVLRRAPSSAEAVVEREPTMLSVRDVEMNVDARTVTRAGEPVELTLKEFEILRILLEHVGQVVRRSTLMDEVWDTNWYGSDKTLDVHISSLRRKLGDDPSEPGVIHTVRGVGFQIRAPEG